MDFHYKDIPNSYWISVGRGKGNKDRRAENKDYLLSLVYIYGCVYLCTHTHIYGVNMCICICRGVCIHLSKCTYKGMYSVAKPECYGVLNVCGNKLYLFLFCAVSLLRHSVLPLAMVKKEVYSKISEIKKLNKILDLLLSDT